MSIYEYEDYNKAYFSKDFTLCQRVGSQLLSKLTDERSKELLEQLNNLNQIDTSTQEGVSKMSKILEDVKIWLMVMR